MKGLASVNSLCLDLWGQGLHRSRHPVPLVTSQGCFQLMLQLWHFTNFHCADLACNLFKEPEVTPLGVTPSQQHDISLLSQSAATCSSYHRVWRGAPVCRITLQQCSWGAHRRQENNPGSYCWSDPKLALLAVLEPTVIRPFPVYNQCTGK